MESKEKEVMLPYVIIKDGNGFENKVCNFSHPDVCKRKGSITIEAIRRTNRHASRVAFRRTTDKSSGIIYGIPQGIDKESQDITFMQIILPDCKSYDLSNEQDAKEWSVVRMQPFMIGSPLQSGKPLYRIYDKEEEANTVINKVNDRMRATDVVKSLNSMQQIDMVRNMGMSPEFNSPTLLLAQIYQLAEKDPSKFLEIWDNSNRNVMTIINRAKAVGLITLDPIQGYQWKKGIVIGMNEPQMVDYLMKNPQLYVTIDMESRNLDTLYKKYGADIEEKSYGEKDKSESPTFLKEKADFEKEKADFEAKKKELEELLAKAKSADAPKKFGK